MRLFVAIDLPEEHNRRLAGIGPDSELDGVRWYPADQLHLTLKFIGEEPPGRLDEITEQLTDLPVDPFTMTVQGLGYFPPNRHPRVIWAGLDENRRLQNLQQNVENMLESIGIEPEKRDFTPHITLGKNKSVNKTRVEQLIEEHKHLLIEDITVDRFTLYASELHPDGAEHIPQAEFMLGSYRESG